MPGGFDSRFPPPSFRLPELTGVDIVLIGGGHAHVEVLRRAAMRPFPDARLTVVTRDVLTPYSGMLPAYLAGFCGHDEAHIDLRPLCARAGARLIHAAAAGLDADARRVLFAARPPLGFDIASLDIGASTAVAAIADAAVHGLPVKPVDRFLARWRRVEAAVAQPGAPFRVTVVGGGAAGVELCLGLRRRLAEVRVASDRDPAPVTFTLVTSGATLLARHGTGARRRLERALRNAGIAVTTGLRVTALEAGHVVLDDGRRIASDATVLATGAAAAPWLGDSGLALDGEGFVAVDACLRSLSHPLVMAAGDVAGFGPRPLEKNGVHAVRQGPSLARNLRRLAAGRSPLPWRPQRRTLALISTGARHAVASRGRFAFEGVRVWRWKDRIDRRWMTRYRDLPAMDADADVPMRCGGCGAKVPQQVLRRALERLSIGEGPDVVIGLEAPDDAAVTRVPEGMAMVQTVDQFPAFLDDPWLFGRVAAVHALSDIHAMGARPGHAMVMAGLLPGSATAMEEDLVQMLSGVLSILETEDCSLVGGHTSEAERTMLGLAVTGFVREAALTRASGLAPGNVLVLTRPLGTGTLFAADMRGEASSPWIEAALAGMQRSNGPAARLLAAHGATAVTDVTGFGLAGHLRAMAAASGVGVRVDPAAVPAYPGARALLARGIASTLHPGNVAALAGELDADDADPLLFDPQTAGGLLAGLPEEAAAAAVRRLRDGGEPDAAVIGRVTGAGPPVDRDRRGQHAAAVDPGP